MPSVAQMYAGDFLKLDAVLAAGPQEFTIKAVDTVQMRKGFQLELAFRETPKRLTLNKTSATNLAQGYGDNTDGWVGRGVQVTPGKVKFGAGLVDAVVCFPVHAPAAPTGGQAKPAPARGNPGLGAPAAESPARFTLVGQVLSVETFPVDGKTRYGIGLETGGAEPIRIGTYHEGMAAVAKGYAANLAEAAVVYTSRTNKEGRVLNELVSIGDAPAAEGPAEADIPF